MSDPGEITDLLAAARQGEAGALDQLMPLVYNELRRLAHRQRAKRGPTPTLDTGALVNEAYLKLAASPDARWNDRAHFFSVASVAMRHILVDNARRHLAKKRGAGHANLVFDDARVGLDAKAEEILAVEQALESLSRLSKRLVKLVELRFFAGLSVDETAAALEVSPRTVKRDWHKARVFLFRALKSTG